MASPYLSFGLTRWSLYWYLGFWGDHPVSATRDMVQQCTMSYLSFGLSAISSDHSRFGFEQPSHPALSPHHPPTSSSSRSRRPAHSIQPPRPPPTKFLPKVTWRLCPEFVNFFAALFWIWPIFHFQLRKQCGIGPLPRLQIRTRQHTFQVRTDKATFNTTTFCDTWKWLIFLDT